MRNIYKNLVYNIAMTFFRTAFLISFFSLTFITSTQATENDTTQVEKLFPRSIELSKGTATVYEPQLESHNNFKEAIFWAAVSYTSFDNKVNSIGAIKVSAKIVADFENRLIHVYSRSIIDSYFPEVSEEKALRFRNELQNNFKKEVESFPMDVFLTAISDSINRDKSANFSTQAPKIFYSEKKAVLVNIEGKEITQETSENSQLYLIINSSWDIFLSKESNKYYLLYAGQWIESDSLTNTNWSATKKRPKAFNSLPQDERFDAARNALEANPIRDEEIPVVLVSNESSELIQTEGPPQYERVPNTGLYFVSNTSSDVIFDGNAHQFYFLTSGRWFVSKRLNGPWEMTQKLPESFSLIPEDHERSHVRASIPDTAEAKFSVLEAQLPKTAVVENDLDAPKVTYAGTPKFVEIKDTQVTRAENTSFDVFRVANKYYLCYQAVWFVGKDADGPWKVAKEVPAAIYDIPETDPAYHVTFVIVDHYTPTHVHYSYTSGYHYSYVSYGVVVYGSGYYWPPYYYDPFYYPYYYGYWHYPHHHHHHRKTYGSASYYNPRTGRYIHGDFSYGPHGGKWKGERHNSRTGRTGHGEYRWDHNSSEFKGHSYSPRTGISTETKQSYQYHGNNEYDSWGKTKVQKGDNWIRSERHSNEKGREFSFEDSKGGEGKRVVTDKGRAGVYKTGSGDLYAGKNGNVYRKNENGNWEKRSNGSWKPINSNNSRLTQSQKNTIKTNRANLSSQQKQKLQNYRSNQNSNSTQRSLNRDSYSRNYGNKRYQSYQKNNRNFGGSRNFGGGSRSFKRSSGSFKRR